MNYAIVAGAAGIALVVIAVVTRKKKFYTVQFKILIRDCGLFF